MPILSAGPARLARRGTASLVLLAWAAIVAAQPVATPWASDPAGATTVEPVRRWARFEELEWRGEPIELYLRTGYERPLILPEPVRALGPIELPGCRVEIDVEVVSFSPSEHFEPRTIVLVGEQTGSRYHFRVRSNPFGQRIPLRVIRR